MFFHPGCGAADDECAQHQNSCDEQTERVDQHQRLEVCMAGEHRLYPENSDAADAQRCQNGRCQRDAEPAQIAGQQLIQQAENVAEENDGQAGIAQRNDLWVAVEQGQQRMSEVEYNAHKSYGDEKILHQAEHKGFAAAIKLACAVVLPHKGGAGLTEGVEHVVSGDLDVVSCTGCRNHYRTKTVDGRMHNDVGEGKDGALDTGGQPDLNDFGKVGAVKTQGAGAHTNRHIRVNQAGKQEQRADCIGNDRGNGNAVDRHLQYDDKEQVEQEVQHTGKGQRNQRRFGVTYTAENGGFKVVQENDRKPQQINAKVQQCEGEHVIRDVQHSEQRRGGNFSQQRNKYAARKRHQDGRMHRTSYRLVVAAPDGRGNDHIRTQRNANKKI